MTVESLPTQDYIQSLTDTVAVIDESLQAIERQQRHFIHVRFPNFCIYSHQILHVVPCWPLLIVVPKEESVRSLLFGAVHLPHGI